MSSLFINIKDDITKERVNEIYMHEDAAYNYIINNNLQTQITGKNMYSIELSILDNLVINTSRNAIVIYLPDKLNDLQKEYLYYINDYLKDNYDKVWICDILKIDNEIKITNYNKFSEGNEIDNILNKKLEDNNKVFTKKK